MSPRAHYTSLADQAEGLRHHEHLRDMALGGLAFAVLLVLIAAVIG